MMCVSPFFQTDNSGQSATQTTGADVHLINQPETMTINGEYKILNVKYWY